MGWKILILYGVSLKNLILRQGKGVGIQEKPICRRKLPKKWGLRQFADLRGRGLDKKEGMGFLRGELILPMHTTQLVDCLLNMVKVSKTLKKQVI